MTAERPKLRLQQMLHGYSGGHRLLAGSTTLSRSSERRMREATDLSGPSVQPGFKSYVSGYPLSDDDMFVVSRTWYADEMPRPGCVWTHSILLVMEQLQKIDDCRSLLRLFRRPENQEFSAYQEPLEWQPSIGEGRDEFEIGFAKNLIVALYSDDPRPVAIVSSESSRFEEWLLEVWTQQWSSLRAEFSFCSGVLDLHQADQQLDLIVIPSSDSRLKKRAEVETTLLEPMDCCDVKLKAWQTIAAKNLIDRNVHPTFRRFLQRFGDDKHATRAHFSKFARCFSELDSATSQKDDIAQALSAIGREFPSMSDAEELKVAVAGTLGKREFFKEADDVDLLVAIVDTEPLSAFDFVALDVANRLKTVWSKSRTDVMQLLGHLASRDDSQNDDIVDTLAEVVSDEDMVSISRSDSTVAKQLLRVRPEFARNSEVWKCIDVTVEALGSRFIDAVSADDRLASRIVDSQIQAGRDDVCQQMEDVLKAKIVDAILEADPDSIAKIDRQRSSPWLGVLKKHANRVTEWIGQTKTVSPEAATIATRVVDLSKTKTRKALFKEWSGVLTKAVALTDSTVLHARVAFLAAVLELGGKDSEQIVCESYPQVYSAAAAGALPDSDWSLLINRLPDVGFRWDWCKRLREGLLRQCVNRKWAIDTFLHCIDDDALSKLLSNWWLSKPEKKYLKSVVNAVLGGRASVTDEQRAVVDRSQKSFW